MSRPDTAPAALPPIRFPVADPRLGEAERRYVIDCLDSHWISSAGKYITDFEELFASTFGAAHAVAAGSGTMAIDLALTAVGVAPGDEVIVPNLTFAGSVSPIYRQQAVPVLAPTAADHWNLDAGALEALITPKTRAVVAVHLYGVPCDIRAVVEVARRHGLKVVEDCAEALGARVDGRFVGTFGDVACYSFYGNKVLTTGEGGMCVTGDAELAERLRRYRDHGMSREHHYWHRVIGYNGRMTNLQAAVGLGQLEEIGEAIARRAAILRRYEEHFDGKEYFLRVEPPADVEPVNWLVSPVLAPGRDLDRDRLLAALRREGIDSRRFFYPIASMPGYSRFGTVDEHSAFFSSHGFCLPTYTGLGDGEIDEIATTACRLIEAQDRPGSGRTRPLALPPPTPEPVVPDVSIVLPTYEEEGNAVRIVGELRRQMVSVSKAFEVLVMDDQSRDRTVAEIEAEFAHDPRIRVVVRDGPRGLADSIYDGIRMARGTWVLVMDSDFNHDPAVTGGMVKMAEFYDIVSGSRFTTGGGMQSRLRWWCSLVFNLFIRVLLVLPTQDNLAGFYCIRRERLRELDLDHIFRDYGDYFFRLLYEARANRMSILEIPVWSRDRDYGVSKTPFIRTLMLYTWAALRLRLRRRRRRRGDGRRATGPSGRASAGR